MTRDEAVAEIQFRLGNRSDLFDQIVSEMKRAQRLLEMGKSLWWWPIFPDQTVVTTLGQQYVALPGSDLDLSTEPNPFLREWEEQPFQYTSSTGKKVVLQKVRQLIGDRTFRDADAGAPRAYSLNPSLSINVYPVPDAAYTLTYGYYASGGTLDVNDASNFWLQMAPDVLIGKAGAGIARIIKHESAATYFDAMFQEAYSGAVMDEHVREVQNKPIYMGSRL